MLMPLLIILTLFTFLKITNDTTNFMNIHYDKAYPFITYGIIRCILDYCLGIMAYLIYEQQNSNYFSNSHTYTMLSIIQENRIQ